MTRTPSSKLGLLQGVIDDLPTEVQTEIAMHILADDPQAALAAAQRGIEEQADLQATMDVNANVQPALDQITRLRNAILAARLLAIVAGVNVSAGAQSAAAPSAPAAVPTSITNVTMHLPRGTRPDDAVRALDRHARRNGRSRATRR